MKRIEFTYKRVEYYISRRSMYKILLVFIAGLVCGAFIRYYLGIGI